MARKRAEKMRIALSAIFFWNTQRSSDNFIHPPPASDWVQPLEMADGSTLALVD